MIETHNSTEPISSARSITALSNPIVKLRSSSVITTVMFLLERRTLSSGFDKSTLEIKMVKNLEAGSSNTSSSMILTEKQSERWVLFRVSVSGLSSLKEKSVLSVMERKIKVFE